MREEIIYRIKTQGEFLSDFGDNWRDKVRCSFPKVMDKLLGKEISEEKYHMCVNMNSTFNLEGYNISKDMITKEIKTSKDERYGDEWIPSPTKWEAPLIKTVESPVKVIDSPITKEDLKSKKVKFPF